MTDAVTAKAFLNENAFIANRATGQIALSVAASPRGSRRTRVHESGSLRMRFPNGADPANLDAVIVNTAGGMTGGDSFGVAITVGAGAKLTVTTAAAEKIYRSLGPDTEIGVKLAVGPGATLSWLPQETIMFDRARLGRTIDVDVAANASLLVVEAILFGRLAMGEVVARGSLLDRWRVRVGGALAFAETIRLDGPIGDLLAGTAVARSSAATASVLKLPGNEDAAERVRAIQASFAGEVGVSAWNGLAVARLIAPDGAALRRDLVAVLTTWGVDPLPRLWLN
jgi:urease accessory protein